MAMTAPNLTHSGRPAASGVMTLGEIAEKTGWSLRTISSSYKSALEKLRSPPYAFELILERIHAVAAEEQCPIQCGSVECDRLYH